MMRCNSAAPQVIEICRNGSWTSMQTCGSGEICQGAASGQASCVLSASMPESCMGIMCDDKCVPNDEKNCGTCGHDCTALPNVSGPTSCKQGSCEFPSTSCEPGFAHCSKDPDAGCEVKLSSETHCGACDMKCAATAPICAMKSGATAANPAYECSTGCSADAPALCGMSCVNVMTDAAHCGDCNGACPAVESGQAVCSDGKCGKKCNSGYHLCGDSCVSDKAPGSCGSACTPCNAPSGAKATCDGKTCGFSCTSSSALKCSDGCYPSDDTNCGSCGNNCRASGRVCDAGRCVECRDSGDCRGSARYCVRAQCKACDPGDSSTCGKCEECSSAGTCMSTGTAKVCYRDADGDGYGGKTSPMNVCGSCPGGYVEDNRDCYDVAGDSKSTDVHPGQTNYFEEGYAGSKFDYDCNGRDEAKNPSWRIEDCMCASGSCAPYVLSSSVPCGQTPSECIEAAPGADNSCTLKSDCFSTPGWSKQSCR